MKEAREEEYLKKTNKEMSSVLAHVNKVLHPVTLIRPVLSPAQHSCPHCLPVIVLKALVTEQ